ncbi:MAG: hypothetical protein AAFY03_11125 [Pseudomonadota bacterium]
MEYFYYNEVRRSLYAQEQAIFAELQAKARQRRRQKWRLWLARLVAGRSAARRAGTAGSCIRQLT